MIFNGTCNATLDDLRIGSSEVPIAGGLTFHDLGLIIAAGCTLIAILLSFYLIWMHALHYTKPREQRHIIRILFMVPVYAVASFLGFWFYWEAIYFEVISDCYEAVAIAAFFSLLCHYIAPDLHEQKAYFRRVSPKPWVFPISTLRNCCGGERGPWRTPRSGLTWFNVIWTGIYQYCFIRVTMTITAVVTQYFGKYCQSSNSPLFASIWIEVIDAIAVFITMYCLIQFYIQLRFDLAPYKPFIKVVSIKLVIFLSFWQSFLISILTSSSLNILKPTAKMAYPDLLVGIPSLLLCIEMAIFSVLHLFAFPYKPYTNGMEPIKYPSGLKMSELGPKQGGFLGINALIDAMNPLDLVKGFARGMRWLFVGRKHREDDPSYKRTSFDIQNTGNDNDMTLGPTGLADNRYKGTEGPPIADEFRRSNFGTPSQIPLDEEGAGLIAHAQPNPLNPGGSGYVPARQRYDANGQDISSGGTHYDASYDSSPDRLVGRNPTPGTIRRQQESQGRQIGVAVSQEPEPYQSHVVAHSYEPQHQEAYSEQERDGRRQQLPSEQWANSSRPARAGTPPEVLNTLWGPGAYEERAEENQF